MVRARAGRSVVSAIVAVLVAGSLAWVVDPPSLVSADPCPTAVSGHWQGSGFTSGGFPFTIDSTLTYSTTAMTGLVSVNGGPDMTVNGTVSCADIVFGTVSSDITFEGTLAPDGRSASGTYAQPGDTGTWTNALSDADSYALETTSIAQPTTIASGAATSWFIDVENIGTVPAANVEVEFTLGGPAAYGPLSETSVSQGPGCFAAAGKVFCDIGTLLVGQKESAQVVVRSTGAAGTQILLDGFASSLGGGGVNDFADPVTVNVVAPAALPPGEASGIAKPGVNFITPGKVTEANPIVVKFKLPPKVAAGSTGAIALGANHSKSQRFIDGASLVSYRTGPGRARIVGRPKVPIPTVKGPPVPMSISRISAEATTFCGGAACSGDVIHLTSFSGYNDRKHPAKVTITWDASVRGRGTGSVIYKRGDSATSPQSVLPTCAKNKLGFSNLPCVFKKKLLKTGDVQFLIYLLSGDPKFGRR